MTKCELPTPYSFQDVAGTRFYSSRSLKQCHRSNQGHTKTLHKYNPKPMTLPSINFLHLTVSEIKPRQDFIVKVTKARSKVKSRPYHDDVYLQPLTNVPTKYQLPTPYAFHDIPRIRFSNSRSLWQGHTMILQTYIHPLSNVPTKDQLSTPYGF